LTRYTQKMKFNIHSLIILFVLVIVVGTVAGKNFLF
jgi:hypothetical protein